MATAYVKLIRVLNKDSNHGEIVGTGEEESNSEEVKLTDRGHGGVDNLKNLLKDL